jgi:hypothetical protein
MRERYRRLPRLSQSARDDRRTNQSHSYVIDEARVSASHEMRSMRSPSIGLTVMGTARSDRALVSDDVGCDEKGFQIHHLELRFSRGHVVWKPFSVNPRVCADPHRSHQASSS